MKTYQVDAFTDTLFKGNPAAVCILEHEYPDATLQNIALEMNLSETAFLQQVSANEFNLRWFTPETEVKLCGHGTLSAAHILWETNLVNGNKDINFNTLSGALTAKKKQTGKIELDLPKGQLKRSLGDDFLLTAFLVAPKFIYEDDLVYLLEFASEDQILKLKPEYDVLKKAQKKEIIVTSKADNRDYDFISRFFAPAIGINEDPVTGSAHCYLAPYWIERLKKAEVLGFQASKRTGYISCKLRDDRVILEGEAITVLIGRLQI